MGGCNLPRRELRYDKKSFCRVVGVAGAFCAFGGARGVVASVFAVFFSRACIICVGGASIGDVGGSLEKLGKAERKPYGLLFGEGNEKCFRFDSSAAFRVARRDGT